MVRVAVAVFVLALAMTLWLPGGGAEAAANGLSQSQVCNAGKADVTFRWQNVNPQATQVWLDLSTSNNGWRNGTFISAGPFDATTASYSWAGLAPGKQHYFRINQQLPSGRWEGSETSPFFTSCLDPAAGGATAEEIRYRNQSTAMLYAWVVKVKQSSRYSPSNTALFSDLISSFKNLEPVPPRFQDAHYNLLDSLNRANDYLLNPPGGRYVRADFDDLLDDLDDAFDDYILVVGVAVPSLR